MRDLWLFLARLRAVLRQHVAGGPVFDLCRDCQVSSMTAHWEVSYRADPEVRPLADRHYNRQKIGATGFAPPGRCMVLKHKTDGVVDAFWITSFPFAQYVRHAWAGAFVCSAFRNESPVLSSTLVIEAVAHTVRKWPESPEQGMITFVNRKHVKKKRDFGRCYLKAGFQNVGETKGGLVALQLPQWALQCWVER